MVALLIKENDSICDECVFDYGEGCINSGVPETVDKTAVGDIVVCDLFKTEAMLNTE